MSFDVAFWASGEVELTDLVLAAGVDIVFVLSLVCIKSKGVSSGSSGWS